MRKEGKDALVGAEAEAVSSSGLIMEARYSFPDTLIFFCRNLSDQWKLGMFSRQTES